MKRFIYGFLTFIVTLVSLCPVVQARDENDIEYDIFHQDGILTVWIDLSFILSPANRKKLQNGIDLTLEYQLTLASLRRLWGSRPVIQTDDAIKISYRQITEDFFLTNLNNHTTTGHRFISGEKLEQYLKDSVYISLTPVDSLDAQKRYMLEIKITSISLTAINLLTDGGSPDSTQSALKSLFKEFLSLTGYGRKEFSVKSRSFSLSELFQGP